MSLRAAWVTALVLGLVATLTGVITLLAGAHLGSASRISMIWLCCVGIALVVGAFGLMQQRLYGARVLIVVCSLWGVVQIVGVLGHLAARSHWPTASWVIIGVEVTCCAGIVAAVIRNSGAIGRAR